MNTLFEVEAILDDREQGGVRYFFLKWKGYNDSENSWEPQDALAGCRPMLRAYLSSRSRARASASAAPRPPLPAPGEDPDSDPASRPRFDGLGPDDAVAAILSLECARGALAYRCQLGDGRVLTVASQELRHHCPLLLADFASAQLQRGKTQGATD
jgi:hypothetical protein